MSSKKSKCRIPYQVAAYRLKNRLDASPGEIALWVAGFVPGAKLVAFTSELDDAAPLDFQSNVYCSDPDWLDYGKKLSGCYFDELAVESITPAERFVDMQRALERLQGVMADVPDPAGLIRTLIENDRLECAHPIAGVPDLQDEVQFRGALVNERELEDAIGVYFPQSHAPTAPLGRRGNQQADAGPGPRVAWRKILNANIADIDREHGGKATVVEVIRWLRRHGGTRIIKEGEPDELRWLDDSRTPQRAKKSTVSNAISAARRERKGPS